MLSLLATPSLQATTNYSYTILLISECIYRNNHYLILRLFVIYFVLKFKLKNEELLLRNILIMLEEYLILLEGGHDTFISLL